MLDNNKIEKEITVLEKHTEELIHAYNALLARYTSLKNDFSNIDRAQEIQKDKLTTAQNKLSNLISKLKNIEANHEQ